MALPLLAAGATVASGLIGGIGSSKAAKKQAKAAAAAAALRAEAGEAANVIVEDQLAETQEMTEPWRLAGVNALEQIQETPDFSFNSDIFARMADPASDFNYERKAFDFEVDPSYRFRQEEGISALDQSAASRGNILSGAQQKAAMGFNSELASQEYGNAVNRYLQDDAQRYGQESGDYKMNMDRQTNNAMNQYNVEAGQYDMNMDRQQYLANTGANANTLLANVGATAAGRQSTNLTGTADAVNTSNMAGATAQAEGISGIATAGNQAISNFLLDDSFDKTLNKY